MNTKTTVIFWVVALGVFGSIFFFLGGTSKPNQESKQNTTPFQAKTTEPTRTPSQEPTKASASGISPNENGLLGFLKSKDPQGQWKTSEEGGRILTVSGGLIPHPKDRPEADLELSKNIFANLGLVNSVPTVSVDVLPNTPYTAVKVFDQVIDGFRVYGGGLKFTQRLSDGGKYMLSTDLHRLESVSLEIIRDFESIRSKGLKAD